MHEGVPEGRRQALARWCHRTGLLPPLRLLSDLVARHDLRILAYHRVLEAVEPPGFDFDLELISASAEAFREQMLYVRRNFAPMRFDEVVEHVDQGRALPKGAVLVSFDDGYDDNYRLAFPILRELGMSAMFFVSTGHIDSGLPYAFDWLVHMLCRSPAQRLQVPELELDWALADGLPARRAQAAELLRAMKALDAEAQEALIARLEQLWGMPRAAGAADCRPMSWAQLRQMRAAGMEVGSHGIDHCMLAKLPRQRMRAEVEQSGRRLEHELGGKPVALSYPVGGPDSYDAETVAAVRAAGYRIACSYVGGTVAAGRADMFALPRIAVERTMGLDWFAARLAVPGLFIHSPRQRAGRQAEPR